MMMKRSKPTSFQRQREGQQQQPQNQFQNNNDSLDHIHDMFGNVCSVSKTARTSNLGGLKLNTRPALRPNSSASAAGRRLLSRPSKHIKIHTNDYADYFLTLVGSNLADAADSTTAATALSHGLSTRTSITGHKRKVRLWPSDTKNEEFEFDYISSGGSSNDGGGTTSETEPCTRSGDETTSTTSPTTRPPSCSLPPKKMSRLSHERISIISHDNASHQEMMLQEEELVDYGQLTQFKLSRMIITSYCYNVVQQVAE